MDTDAGGGCPAEMRRSAQRRMDIARGPVIWADIRRAGSPVNFRSSTLWFFICGRAIHERVYGELKSGFAFDCVPTQCYQANSACNETRNMAISPDGAHLYVMTLVSGIVGSSQW